MSNSPAESNLPTDSLSASATRRPIPGTPPDPAEMDPAFRRLYEVIARLRSDEGCPWDREQTLETIKSYTLEETYELLEAIDSGDDEAIVEELGDVLLQVLLDAQIGADEGRFSLLDVVNVLTKKLIDRHPHVFGEVVAETPGEVVRNWDAVKQEEKQRDSIFEGIPTALPQLARAMRITHKAARVGYDFPHRAMLFDKLREEIDELSRELYPAGDMPDIPADTNMPPVQDEAVDDAERQSRIESELGDVLFVLANIARRWKVNPEEALRKSNEKFQRRFQHVETGLKSQHVDLRDATLPQLEKLYQEAKRQGK